MKDPVRLIDQGATAAELALLRAGAGEEPPEHGMNRVAVALGLGATATVSTLAPKAAAAGSTVRGALSKVAAKWLVVGAVGVVSGAAIVFGSGVLRHDSQPARATHAVAKADDVPAPTSAVAPVTNETAQDVQPVPSDSVASTPAPGDVARAAPAPSSPSIAREIAALDVARRLLGSGNARGALAALDEYEGRARSGVLRQEATLLRIEALANAGDVTAARRLAHRFLRAHPGSPHEKRVRALIGESP